jgi:hypothetical protein
MHPAGTTRRTPRRPLAQPPAINAGSLDISFNSTGCVTTD